MATARMKFSKGEEVKYISHLDLQRTFQRALRRADIQIAYSQGFNPHPKLSFAMALAVGMTSEGEYVDVELAHPIDAKEMKERLNNSLPGGLRILDCKISRNKNPSLMSTIRESLYRVRIICSQRVDPNAMQKLIKDFLGEDRLVIEKRNKKGKRVERDIRPSIYELSLEEMDRNSMVLFMRLEAGSQNNLKPELVVDKLIHHGEGFFEEYSVRVHRIELLTGEGNSPIENFS